MSAGKKLGAGQPGSDLHCHILPGIDDGARDLDETRALLRLECEQDIRQILFTPHFYAKRMTLEGFLQARSAAAELAAPVCRQLCVSWALGAEVRMEPELLELELAPLGLADTGFLLLEWPFTTYPLWGDEVVRRVFDSGKRPIFAHIERYDYFFEAPERLTDFIADGVLCQMNASTLLRKDVQKQALRLIRDGYVHVLSSDAHSTDKRPPQLGQAFQVVEDKLGQETAHRLWATAGDVYGGRAVDVPVPGRKRRFWPFG